MLGQTSATTWCRTRWVSAPYRLVFPSWAVEELQEGRLGRRTWLRLRVLSALQPHALGLGFDDVRLLRSADNRASELTGLDFSEIARRWGQSPIEAQIAVARESRLGAAVALSGFSGDETNEEPLGMLLRHKDAAVASNAAFTVNGTANPAAYGAFPRLLGRFVRDRRTLSLEEAVRRATSLPADRLGLGGIGRIIEGARADVVVFDPAIVADSGWPERPAAPSVGIDTVILNGRVAASHGTAVSAPNGRVLRR